MIGSDTTNIGGRNRPAVAAYRSRIPGRPEQMGKPTPEAGPDPHRTPGEMIPPEASPGGTVFSMCRAVAGYFTVIFAVTVFDPAR